MVSKDTEVNNCGVPTVKISLEVDSLQKMVQGQYCSYYGGVFPYYRISAMNEMNSISLMMKMCCGLFNFKISSKTISCRTPTAKISLEIDSFAKKRFKDSFEVVLEAFLLPREHQQ